jgi:hypothetical protein
MDAEILRNRAAQALRLAAGATDPQIARRLKAIAAEYIREAIELEKRPRRRTLGLDREQGSGGSTPSQQGGSSQSGAARL